MLAPKNSRFAGTATPTISDAVLRVAGKTAITSATSATSTQNTAYFSRSRRRRRSSNSRVSVNSDPISPST